MVVVSCKCEELPIVIQQRINSVLKKAQEQDICIRMTSTIAVEESRKKPYFSDDIKIYLIISTNLWSSIWPSESDIDCSDSIKILGTQKQEEELFLVIFLFQGRLCTILFFAYTQLLSALRIIAYL